MFKIYITKNFCGCNLCRGSERIITDLDREANEAVRNGSHRQVVVGGRNPRLLTFPEQMVFVSYSAGGNPDQSLENLSEAVCSGSDSSHGCWKIRENQSYSIHWDHHDWQQRDGEVAIVATRP